MTKNRFLDISILLSLITIAGTVIINLQIAKEYQRVDGKTRALFGIIELYRFGYQYYVVFPALIAIFCAVIGWKAANNMKYIAVALALFAILMVFLRIWRLFV